MDMQCVLCKEFLVPDFEIETYYCPECGILYSKCWARRKQEKQEEEEE